MTANAGNGENVTRNWFYETFKNDSEVLITYDLIIPQLIGFNFGGWMTIFQAKGVLHAPTGAGTGPDRINNPLFMLGINSVGGGKNFLSASMGNKITWWPNERFSNFKTVKKLEIIPGELMQVGIRYKKDHVNGMIEIFINGDLCYSYSGNTYPNGIDQIYTS